MSHHIGCSTAKWKECSIRWYTSMFRRCWFLRMVNRWCRNLHPQLCTRCRCYGTLHIPVDQYSRCSTQIGKYMAQRSLRLMHLVHYTLYKTHCRRLSMYYSPYDTASKLLCLSQSWNNQKYRDTIRTRPQHSNHYMWFKRCYRLQNKFRSRHDMVRMILKSSLGRSPRGM